MNRELFIREVLKMTKISGKQLMLLNVNYRK